MKEDLGVVDMLEQSANWYGVQDSASLSELVSPIVCFEFWRILINLTS